jgi:uncharacterized repeat protein (TIGR01451 family)
MFFILFVDLLKMKITRQTILYALLLLAQFIFTVSVQAQVCAAPGRDGVTFSRNTYFPGVGSANAGTNTVSIGAARADADAATTAFAVGDLAMIIQMQNAPINNSNTSSYGDGAAGDPAQGTTGLPANAGAGVYEFKRVTAVGAGSVTFDSPLINSYITANADATNGQRRFQVVRVPQFASLTLPGGTVTTPAWDGATGGLLVLDSSGQLNLNNTTIDANAKGFRGGGSFEQAITSGANVLDYAVAAGTGAPPNTLGAAKGEGIAGTPRFVRGTTITNGYTGQDLGASGYPNSLDYARGAPGNAGGGGNQHNAGGGGGSNAGAGGIGGRSFGFYSATNTGPTCVTLTASFFSCTGDGSRAVGGFGGAGFAPTATRLFMGGGAGAGETNNAIDNPTVAQGSGGNGGGLVFIRAREITGNGTINANGQTGQPGGRDAAGGGGGGGTVIVVTDSTSVPGLQVNTAGGSGGATGLPLRGAETQGTGGGGGGGTFIRSSGLATTGLINVPGGAAGLNEPVAGIFNALDAAAGAGGVANVNFSGAQIPNPNSCYPQLTVDKATTSPSRSTPADTTAEYIISITNAPGVGAAVGVSLSDLLPTPFTLSGTTAAIVYGGGSLGPNPAAATGPTTVVIGTAGGTTANSFFIPPSGVVTATFLVNLNNAPSGLYQNSATTNYSDPTRAVAGGTVTPGGTYNLGGSAPGSNYDAASTNNEDIAIIRPTAPVSCTADEDVVTFNFGAATSITAAGSTVTWATATTSNSYSIASVGSVPRNTVTIDITLSPGVAFVTDTFGTTVFPAQGIQGNVANSLDLNMNSAAPGDFLRFRLNFNRPMNKVRFNMLDVDRQTNNWHDIMDISGFLNGNTTTVPTLTPVTPADFVLSTTAAGARRIDRVTALNCANNDPACNVQVDFGNPVNGIEVLFIAGPGVAAPTSQRVAFNNFSYCVPKRELSLTKVDVTPTFVVGATGTYTLSITNQGGAATNAPVVIQDILQLPGVSFINPQPASAGFSCIVSTTTYAGDTVNCSNAAGLAASSLTTVTLLVSISDNVTATNFDNKAKVAGGGDPNKPNLAATGPISGCTLTNEGYVGGGPNYFSGSDTFAGCAFENTLLVRQANLSVTKDNGTLTLVAGTSTTYTVTFANAGPSAANNSIVSDSASAGLNACTVLSCTPAGSPAPAACPATPANLLIAGGTAIPAFPSNSSVTFLVRCNVIATGL